MLALGFQHDLLRAAVVRRNNFLKLRHPNGSSDSLICIPRGRSNLSYTAHSHQESRRFSRISKFPSH